MHASLLIAPLTLAVVLGAASDHEPSSPRPSTNPAATERSLRADVARDAPAAASSKPPYRLARPVVLIFAEVPDAQQAIYHAYVRLNRRLPLDRGNILIGTAGPEGPFRASNRSHCYSQYVTEREGGDELASPRDGMPVTVSVTFRGTTVVQTTAIARRVTTSQFGNRRYEIPRLRRLGCRDLSSGI